MKTVKVSVDGYHHGTMQESHARVYKTLHQIRYPEQVVVIEDVDPGLQATCPGCNTPLKGDLTVHLPDCTLVIIVKEFHEAQ